jgi:hypothetical protein
MWGFDTRTEEGILYCTPGGAFLGVLVAMWIHVWQTGRSPADPQTPYSA